MSDAAHACSRCGTEAAPNRRVKLRGDVVCVECLDDRETQAVRAALAKRTAEPEPAVAPTKDDGTLGIEAADPSISRRKPCHACGAPIAIDASQCGVCGYTEGADLRSSQRYETNSKAIKQTKGGDRACGACGYSLKGHVGERCPECGQPFTRRSSRFDREEASRNAVRDAYRKPTIMLLVGFAIQIIATLLSDGMADTAWLFPRFGIELVIGVVVFYVLGAMFFGLDAPIQLVILQLAGIYAVTDAVWIGCELVGLWYPIFIVGFVYCGLLADMFEMELQEAVVLALVTFIVKAMLRIGIEIWIMSQAT